MDSIELKPDFNELVHTFLRDAKIHAGVIRRDLNPEVVHNFRNFLVSLNIAIQSIADGKTLEHLRHELSAMTEELVKRDDALILRENQLQEEEDAEYNAS